MANNVTSYSGYRSADSYGSGGPKQKSAKKPNYKSGGMFSTGRAITQAPGTKARAPRRDSTSQTTKTKQVTSAMPSKSSGINKKTKVTSAMPSKRKPNNVTSYGPRKSADAYGSPRKPSRAR